MGAHWSAFSVGDVNAAERKSYHSQGLQIADS